jgi:hypothetical protein
LQQRILFVLEGAGEGLFPYEIRRELGASSSDRSNVRRAIRGLIDRGLVDEDHGRLVLTLGGSLRAHSLLEGPCDDDVPDALEEGRERRRDVEAAMAVLRAENEERRQVHREMEALWDKSGCSFERRRFPGPNQLRIIAVVVRYAENPQLGLPKGAVWRIAGGKKANMLRAIRTLIRQGRLEQTKDGKRLRLAGWAMSWVWEYTQDVVEPPLDDANALVILEGYEDTWGVT